VKVLPEDYLLMLSELRRLILDDIGDNLYDAAVTIAKAAYAKDE